MLYSFCSVFSQPTFDCSLDESYVQRDAFRWHCDIQVANHLDFRPDIQTMLADATRSTSTGPIWDLTLLHNLVLSLAFSAGTNDGIGRQKQVAIGFSPFV